MRVLRLDLAAGSLDLHPFVTVARGLPPATRAELVEILAAIPSGRTDVTGLVEAHGVLLDLSRPTLDLLDLDSDLSVVVTRADMPGAPVPETARLAEARAAARRAQDAVAEADAEVERLTAALDAARHGLAVVAGGADTPDAAALDGPRAAVAIAAAQRVEAERLADAAGSSLAAAEQAVLDAELAANAARDARAAATRAMSVAAAALDAAADRRDPVAVAAVDTARERVAAAEAALVAVRDGSGLAAAANDQNGADAADDVGATLEVLRAERLEVEAAVLALETPDPLPVRLALEQLGEGGPVELVNPPDAVALADRWDALDAHLRALATDQGATAGDRADALRRVRAAEAAVDQAEIGGRPGLEPAAVELLEAAHAEVLAARDAADRRLGGRGARKRLDDALAAEQKVLDRLGFVTYAEYLMGAPGNQDTAAEEPNRLAAARAELIEAQARLRRLDDDVATELRRAELLQQQRTLRIAAVELLGADPGDDVVGALRRFRVPGSGAIAGGGRLKQALEAAGLVIGDEEMPDRFLADLAKVWLDEQELVSAQRRVLEGRVAALDAQIADLQRAASEPERAERPSLTNAVAQLEEARAALRNAEARASRHSKSEAEVEKRRQAFEAAAKAEADAVRALAAVEGDVLGLDDARRRAARDHDLAVEAVTNAVEVETRAIEALAALEERAATAAARGAVELEREESDLAQALAAARTEATDRARAAGEARAALAVVEADEAAAGQVASEEQVLAVIDDTEWYLLARLAAQRAVSFAGSVPFVLDDALAGLDPQSAREVLDRLERMSATVQVIVLTEDLAAAAWATQLGPERAAVVEIS